MPLIPSVGSEFGIGRPKGATNLVLNGGFETNTTGWVANGSATITRSTTQAMYGTAGLKVTATITSAAGAQVQVTLSGSTAGSTYSGSCWIFCDPASTALGKVMNLRLQEAGGAQGAASSDGASVTLVAGWQRLTHTRTIVQDDRTALQIYPRLASGLLGDEFYIDGVQIETGAAGTPYIETNGGTATRASSKVVA